ncbi:UDP-N-acetylmuramate dehydrogenase [Pokkaliibacter sp. CJK22405]|uniref:UDP-N-acetylmuramate dehydrogenase n=1 Tax=Pokkaliibacter sp. CJK22405 TaxID=3384615 RepID=UPI003984C282
MAGEIPEYWQRKVNLAAFNTLGFSVSADYFAQISSVQQLQESVATAKKNSLHWRVLGGGSNVVLREDLPGLTLRMAIRGLEFEVKADSDEVIVNVAAGEVWHELVKACVAQGYSGIENLALIPGSVGAAPVQNIGAYGVELKDVLVDVECFDPDSGLIKVLDASECGFGYRDSVFKHEGQHLIITKVRLKLSMKAKPCVSYQALRDFLAKANKDDPSLVEVMNAVIAIRQSKLPDPAVLANAGSFFKNPVITAQDASLLKLRYPAMPSYPDKSGVKVPAGWLIDQLGLKGYRTGDVAVHEHQALVLVHFGGGTGKDLLSLAEEVQSKVKAEYGIALEQEPVNLP